MVVVYVWIGHSNTYRKAYAIGLPVTHIHTRIAGPNPDTNILRYKGPAYNVKTKSSDTLSNDLIELRNNFARGLTRNVPKRCQTTNQVLLQRLSKLSDR